MTEFRTRYKTWGDDRWLTGAGTTEAECKKSANSYWRGGAAEVMIEKVTTEVVGHKKRSR